MKMRKTIVLLLLACGLLCSFGSAQARDKPNIVLVFMDNFGWGVKWRNWKVNLKEQNNIVTETMNYGMPRIYNLIKDPGETQNVLFPETWVPKAALGQLGVHVMSLRQEPPIKPGTPDPYKPAR